MLLRQAPCSAMLNCSLCPRLVSHRKWVDERHAGYHNRPVLPWGDAQGSVLIVGLAPGLHGAARTGKAFVGDASGKLLFEALESNGFATSPIPEKATLVNAILTNAVKCLPPKNAPLTQEVASCRDHLKLELAAFNPERGRKQRSVVALGGVAYKAVQNALGCSLPAFAHGAEATTAAGLHIIASYHPSRLNVNTGRINFEMLKKIFARVATVVD